MCVFCRNREQLVEDLKEFERSTAEAPRLWLVSRLADVPRVIRIRWPDRRERGYSRWFVLRNAVYDCLWN
jgi:hypothetical protein